MRTSAALVALVLVAAAACSDDCDKAIDKDPPSVAELEAAFRGFQQAYLDGDGARAFEFTSEHCRTLVSRSEMVGLADDYAEFMAEEDHLELTIVKVDRHPADAPKATVTYTLATDDEIPDVWVVEHGEWRHNSC